jgi:hypothetical protein
MAERSGREFCHGGRRSSSSGIRVTEQAWAGRGFVTARPQPRPDPDG